MKVLRFVAGLTALMWAVPNLHAKPTPAPCRETRFEGARFTQCDYAPRLQRLNIIYADKNGVPLRYFQALEKLLGARRTQVAFAVNGGMYDFGSKPIGLFVAHGKTVKPLNRNNGAGNFHLLPNGVFWTDAQGRAFVDTAAAYAARKPAAAFATQSGPMLLINGKLHPNIQPDGPSRKIRNGVGMSEGGGACFVISETPVSFGQFARYFQQKCGAKQALYLDGTVSALWVPAQGRMDTLFPLGPMIVVSSK